MNIFFYYMHMLLKQKPISGFIQDTLLGKGGFNTKGTPILYTLQICMAILDVLWKFWGLKISLGGNPRPSPSPEGNPASAHHTMIYMPTLLEAILEYNAY